MIDAPCPAGWVPNTGICSTWSSYAPEVQSYAQRFATYVLWAATGRRFGLCDVTVRPCMPPAPLLYWTFPLAEQFGQGFIGGSGQVNVWPFLDTCGCGAGCMCAAPTIPLPGPVNSISAVTIDGAVLAPAAYRLEGPRLIRQDGQIWPLTQNQALPAGQVGTFTVQYLRGEPVPDSVNDAAGIYACEVAKARTGGPCALPQRIQTMTRQGVTVQMVDQGDYLDKGRTGLTEVDQIIVSINPDGLRNRPRVLSVDLPRM